MEKLIHIKNILFTSLFKVLSLSFIISDVIALPFWKFVAFLIAKDKEEYKKYTNFKIFNRTNILDDSYEAYLVFKSISAVILFAISAAVIILALYSEK